MRNTRIAGAAAALGTVALLAACRDIIGDPSFDRWCGETLCKWQLDEGRIERVPTWHERDYAVSLAESETRISQLSEQGTVDCIRFEMIVNAEARAELSLELDFNDDGTSDYTRPIPGARWKQFAFDIHAPEHYKKLRFILRKAAEGSAVVAQLRARQVNGCTGPRIELREQLAGAACREGRECSFGMCTDGRCGSCSEDGDCGEGGHCVSGACSACREDDDCGAGERCAWREARSRSAGRTCIPETQQLERGLRELCDRDADCSGTVCAVEEDAAQRCGLPCDEDAACPEGLACRPVLDTSGPSWVSLDLCIGPVAQGAACSEHVECASGRCCDGTCASSTETTCD